MANVFYRLVDNIRSTLFLFAVTSDEHKRLQTRETPKSTEKTLVFWDLNPSDLWRVCHVTFTDG